MRQLYHAAMKHSLVIGCCLSLLLALFATGCASNPLGMNDEEWAGLTAEQQLEARKEDERLRLERERLRQEEQERRKLEQLERDRAEGMILQFAPRQPYCIGGDKCPGGRQDELILSLRRLADVDKVVFYADDSIGRKHNGVIAIYADNKLVAGDIDIKRRGQWHQVLVARPARNITFRVVGDDEVEIGRVKIYGGWATDQKHYIIVK